MCQYLNDAEARFWRIFGFAAMASSPSFLFFVETLAISQYILICIAETPMDLITRASCPGVDVDADGDRVFATERTSLALLLRIRLKR